MSDKSSKEFSRVSTSYDKGREGENFEFWAEEAKRLASLDENSLILDLGCGTGLYSQSLMKETGATICGLDPAVGMLGKAHEKSSDLLLFNAVGEYLPLRDGVFDCVFSSQVWHHITDKQGTANECGRVMKIGGSVVIRTISHEQLREKIVFKYFPEIMENQLRVYPSNEEFKEYFKKAGFTSTIPYAYHMERFQPVKLFIEVAEKKLWSMFRPITQKGMESGVKALRKYHQETNGKPLRNDELITLVVSNK